jgi:hypothetical protein
MTEAIASLRLSELAKPRKSAFGRGQSDTVAEIADLPKLDARTFCYGVRCMVAVVLAVGASVLTLNTPSAVSIL